MWVCMCLSRGCVLAGDDAATQRRSTTAEKFTLNADGNLVDAAGNVVKTERANVSSLKVSISVFRLEIICFDT